MSDIQNETQPSVKDRVRNWWNGGSFSVGLVQVIALTGAATLTSVAVNEVVNRLKDGSDDADEFSDDIDELEE